jgi:hypothetical protein
LIHPVKSFIGKPFFGNYTQQVTLSTTHLLVASRTFLNATIGRHYINWRGCLINYCSRCFSSRCLIDSKQKIAKGLKGISK